MPSTGSTTVGGTRVGSSATPTAGDSRKSATKASAANVLLEGFRRRPIARSLEPPRTAIDRKGPQEPGGQLLDAALIHVLMRRLELRGKLRLRHRSATDASLRPRLTTWGEGGDGEGISAHGVPAKSHPVPRPDADADRYEAVRQYSLAQILGVWAAAAVPMGVLAWIVAPWLRDQLGGDEPLGQALLICLTAGLIWQFVLVLILIRRELGGLEWSRVRDALWLRPPRDPKTGRVGGRVWWWALLFVVLFLLWTLVPAIPGPSVRDFADFLDSDRGEDFFRGAWGWFAVVVVLSVFNTVLGEELLFRGLLLPRMQGVFGRRDWVANGALFAALPLASAVEHSLHPRRRNLPYRLSLATVPERMDGDHRALERASLRPHLRPRPGARLDDEQRRADGGVSPTHRGRARSARRSRASRTSWSRSGPAGRLR